MGGKIIVIKSISILWISKAIGRYYPAIVQIAKINKFFQILKINSCFYNIL